MSSQRKQLPSQAYNDVLAKMLQAEENEGGPPPATPCDTPIEVVSQLHGKAPEESTGRAGRDREEANRETTSKG